MGMPDDVLSTAVIKGEYLYPDNIDPPPLTDYEMGGIALNDPSAGMRYQVWTLDYVGNRVRVMAPNQKEPTVLFIAPDITEVSLAFDQNMRPFVAYVQEGIAKYYWYDTVTAQQTFSDLPAGSKTPRATLDDKRETQTALSDIVLVYIRDKQLFMRKQRDRYGVEYLLAAPIDANIVKIGMTNKGRLQLKLISDV